MKISKSDVPKVSILEPILYIFFLKLFRSYLPSNAPIFYSYDVYLRISVNSQAEF